MGIRIGSARDKYLAYENEGGPSDNACCTFCHETWLGELNEKHKPNCVCYLEWQKDRLLPARPQ